MARLAIAWLSSDRGLLVVGTSLALGAFAYIWVDCLRLWRIRRKTRDMVDLASTAAFTVLIFAIALAMHTWDSLPAAATGLAAAVLSYVGLRRVLRIVEARVD